MSLLDRHLFLQGQRCFFCDRTLPKHEASVEHLVPKSREGTDHPDNLVVCCKSLSTLLGNLTLKQKLEVVLRQRGKFTCPNRPAKAQPAPVPAALPKAA